MPFGIIIIIIPAYNTSTSFEPLTMVVCGDRRKVSSLYIITKFHFGGSLFLLAMTYCRRKDGWDIYRKTDTNTFHKEWKKDAHTWRGANITTFICRVKKTVFVGKGKIIQIWLEWGLSISSLFVASYTKWCFMMWKWMLHNNLYTIYANPINRCM